MDMAALNPCLTFNLHSPQARCRPVYCWPRTTAVCTILVHIGVALFSSSKWAGNDLTKLLKPRNYVIIKSLAWPRS